MIDISRRSLLRGALFVAGTAMLPDAAKAFAGPEIWADGVHDDLDGLVALFGGEPVRVMSDDVVLKSGMAFLKNARFRVRTFPAAFGGNMVIEDALFVSDEKDYFGASRYIGFRNTIFVNRPADFDWKTVPPHMYANLGPEALSQIQRLAA